MILYFLIYSKITKLFIKEKLLKSNILLDKIIILIHKILLFWENIKIAIKRAQKKMK